MGIDLAGAAAGYLGYQDNQRRLADDERRAKDSKAADDAAKFAEETRNEQRRAWQEAEKERQAEKDDVTALTSQLQGATAATPPASKTEGGSDAAGGAAPTASAAPAAPQGITPAQGVTAATTAKAPSMAAAGGTTGQMGDFNQALALKIGVMQRKAARNKLSLDELANMRGLQSRIEKEGVQEALSLMEQGRYDDAMAHYNSVGAMKGARIVEGKEGTTKINGEDRPTHFVTIQNADGTQTKMDVARARYQLLDFSTQLDHAERSDQLRTTREHYQGVREDNKAARDQSAKDAAAGRALQWAHLRQAQQHYDAATPLGQIQAKEKALGRTLTSDEKSTMLGVDSLAPAVRLQVNSLVKEQDQIAQAMSKAQAEGTWVPTSEGARTLQTRAAILNQRMGDLLGGGGNRGAGADPLGLRAPAKPAAAGNVTTVSNPFPQPVSDVHVPARLVPRTGGVPAAQAGAAAPAPAPGASPVARALGLSQTDSAMNDIVIQKAAGIQAAADAVKQASQVFAAVANSGDKASIDTYNKQLQQARDKFNALVDTTGNRRDAVLAAVEL